MIPAFNEEATIDQVVKNVPKSITGITEVQTLVIDDGSTDHTARVSHEAGAGLVKNGCNLGLAQTFKRGLEEALRLGADIIVNIDADGQHDPKEIPKLISPILERQAEMVIGNRQVRKTKEMKLGNKYGNILGSWILRKLTASEAIDASCGFRAFSREAGLRFNIFSKHTYTHETIIQAAFKNLKIINIPITLQSRPVGKSKLIGNLYIHIGNSLRAIFRIILIYKPLKTFFLFDV